MRPAVLELRATTNREITEFPVGAGDRPAEIAGSPDGDPWYVAAQDSKVVTLRLK